MNADLIYRINSPNTVHEIIEGEAIIINMKKGYYYSTDQTGAFIWELVGQNLDVEGMLTRIMKRYAGEPQEVRCILKDFLERLQSENLVSTLSAGQAAAEPVSQGVFNGDILPFSTPELHKYTDLQDLLLLDPIHEVDENGWPGTSPAGRENLAA